MDYELLQIPPNNSLAIPPTARSGSNSPRCSAPRKATQDSQDSPLINKSKLPAIESGVLATTDQPTLLKKAFNNTGLNNRKLSSVETSPSLNLLSRNKPDEEIMRVFSTASLDQTSTTSLETTPKKRKKRLAVRDLSDSTETKSVIFSEEDDRKEFSSSDQTFLEGLVKPEIILTTNGCATCNDLFIPPAPLQDISHLLPESRSEDFPATGTPVLPNSLSKSPTKSLTSKQSNPSPLESSSSLSPSQGKAKNSKVKSGSSKVQAKVERFLQPRRDKYCNPGKLGIHLLDRAVHTLCPHFNRNMYIV